MALDLVKVALDNDARLLLGVQRVLFTSGRIGSPRVMCDRQAFCLVSGGYRTYTPNHLVRRNCVRHALRGLIRTGWTSYIAQPSPTSPGYEQPLQLVLRPPPSHPSPRSTVR